MSFLFIRETLNRKANRGNSGHRQVACVARGAGARLIRTSK